MHKNNICFLTIIAIITHGTSHASLARFKKILHPALVRKLHTHSTPCRDIPQPTDTDIPACARATLRNSNAYASLTPAYKNPAQDNERIKVQALEGMIILLQKRVESLEQTVALPITIGRKHQTQGIQFLNNPEDGLNYPTD